MEQNSTFKYFPLSLIEIYPSAWVEHIPFAFYITHLLKPSVFVELGTHGGISFFAFCQAAKENNIITQNFAVDTWQGDDHAGKYSDSIYNDVVKYQQEHYPNTATLMRMTFDDALNSFKDKSIDLLHIDGLHTYEAVKHDFFSWLPKLSEKAVVLFHDTQERQFDFGVWKLWGEIREAYPSFEFIHGHGLGVLLVGKTPSNEISDFIQRANNNDDYLHKFQNEGSELNKIYELIKTKKVLEKENQKLKYQLDQTLNSHSYKIGSALLKPFKFFIKIFK